MRSAIGNVFVFMLVVIGAFQWVGYTVTEMTGGEKKVGAKVEVSPEGGEKIFWGKGRCYTCHSLGGQGSAVRCPNLGQFGEKFPMTIGSRAVERAKERSKETGQHYTATDYLVESLAVPGAYVVDGFKNEMAIVYAPPISLSLDEIKAVVSYLQSQGGEVDIEALDKPSEITQTFFARIQAASAAGGGDPGNGEIVFEDNCSECHQIGDVGEHIGPELSTIGGKGTKFIAESITRPSKQIPEGYETWSVEEKDGRKTKGLKTRDDANEIDITKATGEVVTIAKVGIKEAAIVEGESLMPADLTEALTVKDFQDVQAYLMMQKGEEAEGEQ